VESAEKACLQYSKVSNDPKGSSLEESETDAPGNEVEIVGEAEGVGEGS
jgi:hypothetical protein